MDVDAWALGAFGVGVVLGAAVMLGALRVAIVALRRTREGPPD